MMVGEFVKNDYPPLYFLLENRQDFIQGLVDYYEKKEPQKILKLLSKTAIVLYKNSEHLGQNSIFFP